MDASQHDHVVAVIQENAASMLRIARMHSICADDAQDAYQRALEIYLERVDKVEEATAGAWLRTVCKHEAMRIRAARQRVLPHEEMDFDARPSLDVGDADERMAGFERVSRAAEALQGCKADEVRALLLKADGSSYAEIGETLGWTYTKVNRCLTEGRRRFLARFAEIDSGAACERWAPVLSAIVDGEATPDQFTAVRPHLRHCGACRATLRELYEAQPALHALLPVAAVATVGGTGWMESLVGAFGDRMAKAQSVVEAISSSKAAAVMASTAVVATGGASAAERPAVAPLASMTPAPIVRHAEPRPSRAVAAAATVVVARKRVQARPVATPTPAPTPPPKAEFAFEQRAAPRPAGPPAAERRRRPSPEFGFEG